MPKYQHEVPQHLGDEDACPELKPKRIFVGRASGTKRRGELVCDNCGKSVVKVADNEGPESLKAFFRF